MSEINSNLQSFLASNQNDTALVFTNGEIWVNNKTRSPIISIHEILETLKMRVKSFHLLNSMLIVNCNTLMSKTELMDIGYEILSVKPYLSTISDDLQELILKGYHWIQWDMQSIFCGKCGSELESKIETTEKKCLPCGSIFYPRFSPAIITVVTKGDKILLARSPHFPPEVYSALAGFVEVGETAEMAMHRELKEEVGIEIKNLKYICSQTWPFPDSFMIAFKAEYKSGNIVLDSHEMEDAKWFDKNQLPKLPEKASISRKLIDRVLNELA